jgi:hypothetical protein
MFTAFAAIIWGLTAAVAANSAAANAPVTTVVAVISTGVPNNGRRTNQAN